MASAIQTSLAEYLATNYEPDREFVDGEVRERNVGKREHARVQALLTAWLMAHETVWSMIVLTEARVQVSPERVRIPDLVLTSLTSQAEVLSEAPVLVIEILSPDDSYSDTEQRAADYQRMGVQAVWIVDPKSRTGRMCTGATWTAGQTLRVDGTEIFVDLEEIFRYLDAARP